MTRSGYPSRTLLGTKITVETKVIGKKKGAGNETRLDIVAHFGSAIRCHQIYIAS